MKTIRLLCALTLVMAVGICHAQQEYEIWEKDGWTFCDVKEGVMLSGESVNAVYSSVSMASTKDNETQLNVDIWGMEGSTSHDIVALENVAKSTGAYEEVRSVQGSISLCDGKTYNGLIGYKVNSDGFVFVYIVFNLERMAEQGGRAQAGTKILDDLCRSDIQSITVGGHKIDVSKLNTAPTIKSMLKTLAERVPGRYSPKDDVKKEEQAQGGSPDLSDVKIKMKDGSVLTLDRYKTYNDMYLTRTAAAKDVVKLPSGLQYRVLRQGSGRKPNASSVVTIRCETRLVDGMVLDSNMETGQPWSMALDRLIEGVTEGVQLMNEGAKYRLFIPYYLAYGERGNQSVPPYSTIIFDVELIKVE